MTKINSKKILIYIFITLISLILVGLVGAIIRLINIPAIIVTLIIIFGLSYYKRVGWFHKILNSFLKIKNEKKLLDLSLTSKKQAADKSLESIENLITLINDKVKAKALKAEKDRVSLELERGDIILVVFGGFFLISFFITSPNMDTKGLLRVLYSKPIRKADGSVEYPESRNK